MRERASDRSKPLENALAEVERVKAELQEACSTIEWFSKINDQKETIRQDSQVLQQAQRDLTYYQERVDTQSGQHQILLRTRADQEATLGTLRQQLTEERNKISDI